MKKLLIISAIIISITACTNTQHEPVQYAAILPTYISNATFTNYQTAQKKITDSLQTQIITTNNLAKLALAQAADYKIKIDSLRNYWITGLSGHISNLYANTATLAVRQSEQDSILKKTLVRVTIDSKLAKTVYMNVDSTDIFITTP